MIDPDDYELKYSKLISDVGIKYTNDDGEHYTYYVEYVCFILNKILNKTVFSFRDEKTNMRILIKGRPDVLIPNGVTVAGAETIYLKRLYEFLENEILLFKLEIIKWLLTTTERIITIRFVS